MGSFQTVLLVGGGGFLGSVLRYGISGLAQRLDPSAGFPVGTLTVNAIGCFLIGLVGALADSRGLFGPEMRLFFFIGVLGGFTTFSHSDLKPLLFSAPVKRFAPRRTFWEASFSVCSVSGWVMALDP